MKDSLRFNSIASVGTNDNVFWKLSYNAYRDGVASVNGLCWTALDYCDIKKVWQQYELLKFSQYVQFLQNFQLHENQKQAVMLNKFWTSYSFSCFHYILMKNLRRVTFV